MNSRVLNIILPIIGVIVYICIDFLYIFLSKSRYESIIEGIQKEKMEIDVAAAIICYAIMGIGWFFVAVQLALSYYDKIKQRSPSWTPLVSSAVSGSVAGFLYGFVVYGIYNLTTRALFSTRYPLWILAQDIAWGSLFNMAYTCIYMIIWRKVTIPVDL